MATEIPPSNGDENQRAGCNNQSNDAPSPPVVSSGPSTPNPDHQTQQRKHKRPHDAFEWASLIVSGILAVATICAAAFAFWLGWLTHVLVGDARDAARDAHLDNIRAEELTSQAIANATANAIQQHQDTLAAISRADIANGIAGGTAKRQLRAYVGVFAANLQNFGTTAEPTSGIIIVKNLGPTPAYQMSFDNWIGLVNAPFGKGLPPTEPRRLPKPTMTLGPNEEFDGKVKTKRPLTQQEVDAVRSGSAELLIWGDIAYFDAFGTRHKTVFRLTYGGENGIVEGGGLHPDTVGNSSN